MAHKLQKREVRLFALTLIVVGSALFYQYFLEPRWARYSRLTDGLDAAQTKLDEAQYLLDHEIEIRLSAGDFVTATISNDDDTEFNSFRREVARLATEAKLEVVGGRSQNRIENKGAYRLMTFELDVEGDGKMIAQFLHELRSSNQLLRVDMMTINALREAGKVKTNFRIAKVTKSKEGF